MSELDSNIAGNSADFVEKTAQMCAAIQTPAMETDRQSKDIISNLLSGFSLFQSCFH